MPQIHPTASVDPAARLADDTVVGPYCCIQGDVTLGPGCRLHGHVYLHGPLHAGRNNAFFPFACIGFPPQHRRYDPDAPGAGLRIGDDNTFRESVTVHRAAGDQPTTLGDRNYLMAGSHVGHDCRVGNDCTLANAALLGGHVELDDGVTLGGNLGIHQFCRVGRLAMASGVVAITQDVPPFCVAYDSRTIASLNLIGLRRAGLRAHIEPLKRAFNLYFLGHKASANALEAIEREVGHDPCVRDFVQFVRRSKRGICSYGGTRTGAATPADELPA